MPGAFASPTLMARATVIVASWEIGVTADIDPLSVWTGGTPPPSFAMRHYAFGVSAGRRQRVGDGALVLGLDGRIGLYEETGAPTAGDAAGGASLADPLAGVYVGVVTSERAHLRMRAELFSDVAIGRVGRPLVIDSALPAVPWLSAGARLGLEGEIP